MFCMSVTGSQQRASSLINEQLVRILFSLYNTGTFQFRASVPVQTDDLGEALYTIESALERVKRLPVVLPDVKFVLRRYSIECDKFYLRTSLDEYSTIIELGFTDDVDYEFSFDECHRIDSIAAPCQIPPEHENTMEEDGRYETCETKVLRDAEWTIMRHVNNTLYAWPVKCTEQLDLFYTPGVTLMRLRGIGENCRVSYVIGIVSEGSPDVDVIIDAEFDFKSKRSDVAVDALVNLGTWYLKLLPVAPIPEETKR